MPLNIMSNSIPDLEKNWIIIERKQTKQNITDSTAANKIIFLTGALSLFFNILKILLFFIFASFFMSLYCAT